MMEKQNSDVTRETRMGGGRGRGGSHGKIGGNRTKGACVTLGGRGCLLPGRRR